MAEPEHLARLEVVGDEDEAAQAEARGVRRDAVAQVAGRRAREHREAEFHGARGGHRHDAVLVGERRVVDAVVLDVQLADAEALGQARRRHQRREAGVESGQRLAGDRQQFAVAPDVARPRRDVLARERGARLLVVVDRLERAEALVTDVGGFRGKRGVAHVALQTEQCGHVGFLTRETRPAVPTTPADARRGREWRRRGRWPRRPDGGPR